ncbi:YhcN/YlaJ family sporulation lipoprotein [Falsibacillus albus]|uniref:Sporulation protein n=1 Tax=Falsibacillus albus TaxID=2478915 RepID=A0A3L7K4H0_9BACI|nr:YhcN/YlaJ family sporulation lipoprotein [Falsibacillus albus]RLQ97164.1 sporulation protein [Falsibacillus albus]
MKKISFSMILAILIILNGCSSNSEQKNKSQFALIKTTNPAPIELKERPEHKSIGYQVRKDVNAIPELYDVAVIEGKKDIIVAYKVKHSKRFSMKKIEKQITSMLEKKYPDENFIVSSDYKIFLEAVRLKEDLDNGKISNLEAGKRFKKIIKLHHEQA